MHSRDKARLFHELGQLLRAGFPLPRALEKLIGLTRGEARAALTESAEVLKNGGTSAEALAAPGAFAGLDSAIFAAGDKSGQLERGLALAADYHQTVANARSRIMVKIAYPVFIIHFSILAFAMPKFATEGMDAFLWTLAANYGILWACVIGIWLVWRFIQSLAERQAAMDHLLSAIPLLGGLRRKFALSRFCLAYDMQLEAGINVFSALEHSAAAAGGAAFAAAGRRAVHAVRAGEPISAALAGTGVFPESVVRVFDIGENTGQLDAELQRVATDYRNSAVQRIELVVEWLPRVALIVIGAFIAYRVVEYYTALFQPLRGL